MKTKNEDNKDTRNHLKDSNKDLKKILRAGANLFTGKKNDNKEVKDTIYSLISCSAATLSRWNGLP
jgi:hypothetical protein